MEAGKARGGANKPLGSDETGGDGSVADRLRFERTLSEIATSFIHLRPADVDDRIRAALRRIVEVLSIDRSVLTQLPEPGTNPVAYSYTVSGIGPAPQPTEEKFPYLFERARLGEVVSFSSLDELPEEAAVDRRTFAQWGVKSHVTVPMMSGNRLLGGLSFGSLRRERKWTTAELDRLRLVANTLINALARKGGDLELRAALDSVSDRCRHLLAEVRYLREEVQDEHDFTEIVGESRGLTAVLSRIDQVAATDASVLILGETGTGKELIARAIHERSGRRERPLVKVNCASLPSTLIESELFGHEKGAFTGAVAKRVGRFELADGGTLFLDEIGEMSPDLQSKLLRVLQEGEFERLGAVRTTQVDVRVVAATNRDLATAIAEGRFRSDLYYRLAVFPIEIPPLRERRSDIPLLVWHFITKLQVALGKAIESVPEETMDTLYAYDWPGNVRELQNIVERSLILSPGSELRLDTGVSLPSVRPESRPESESLEDVERAHMIQILESSEWRVKGKGNAADRLGLNESTLRFRMKKLGIERPS